MTVSNTGHSVCVSLCLAMKTATEKLVFFVSTFDSMWLMTFNVFLRVSAFSAVCVSQGSGENARAVPTDQLEDVDCGLIISSIGYKSIAIDPTVPFDPRRAVVPNDMGRVQGTPGENPQHNKTPIYKSMQYLFRLQTCFDLG